MQVNKKKVKINLRSEIIDQAGDIERTEESHVADFFKKGDMLVWLFNERQEGVGDISHQISFRDDLLTIKRSGAVKMQQKFIVDQKTECLYRHPYGKFLMEIITHKLEEEYISDNETKILIEYDMITNDEKRQFKIRIESMEVPS